MPEGREPVRAVIVEILPSLTYRLEVEGSRAEVIAHPAKASGKNFVRLRVQDVVLVELSAEDPGRGRVVRVVQS